MSRNKFNQVNIDKTDLVKYPDGRIRDNDGSGNGTPVNEIVYGDIHEFLAKAMRLYDISFNGLPDNTLNGYQFLDAIIALASKNDFLLDITTDGVLIIPLKLNLVTEGEAFVCIAQADFVAETQIKGSLDSVPILKNVTFKGGDYKTGDYLRVIITAVGVDIVRLADGDTLDLIATEFGYLKAASLAEEQAGAIDTVATTPLTNFTVFAERVVGVQSGNYLATAIRNGLLSKEDKVKIDAADKERNYGTFGPVDVDFGNIGDFAAVSGDIDSAQITDKPGEGEVWTITFDNAMDNTNYDVILSVESLGASITLDNDIKVPIWKKINNTQIKVYLEETNNVTQSIKIHVTVKQR